MTLLRRGVGRERADERDQILLAGLRDGPPGDHTVHPFALEEIEALYVVLVGRPGFVDHVLPGP